MAKSKKQKGKGKRKADDSVADVDEQEEKKRPRKEPQQLPDHDGAREAKELDGEAKEVAPVDHKADEKEDAANDSTLSPNPEDYFKPGTHSYLSLNTHLQHDFVLRQGIEKRTASCETRTEADHCHIRPGSKV
jgi:hypothetical protein